PVVEHLRAPERVLEVRLRMRATEEMSARTNFAQGIHRLPVLAEVDPLGQRMQDTELIRIEHELLIARDQPPFEPAASMQHEVYTPQQRRLQRVRTLISRLRIRQLR